MVTTPWGLLEIIVQGLLPLPAPQVRCGGGGNAGTERVMGGGCGSSSWESQAWRPRRGEKRAEKHCRLQGQWPHSVSQAITVSRLKQPSASASTLQVPPSGRVQTIRCRCIILSVGVEWGWQLPSLLPLPRLGEWEGVLRSRCAFPALRSSTCCLWSCSFMPSMPADASSNVRRMERLRPCREK